MCVLSSENVLVLSFIVHFENIAMWFMHHLCGSFPEQYHIIQWYSTSVHDYRQVLFYL